MVEHHSTQRGHQDNGAHAERSVLTKAKQLQCECLAECVKHNVIPEHVDVNHRWLNRLLATYRIPSWRPNRKFKVPRTILMQRLEIFWIVTARLRTMVMVHFGYDPTFKNIDQQPFHQNEAGSQEWNTLTLMGANTVPLIENHAATRERWSLNSLTDSVEEQISDDNMPGFEIMFKAEGKQVEAKLQAYVSKKKILGMRVTVVTGASGSYRDNDIVNVLENHFPLGTCPPMGNVLARCIRARSDGQCLTVWLV